MKSQSVVSLDPIERTRKRQDSPIGRLFKTRHYGGKRGKFPDPFGHYLFVGKQRMGKTASMIWYYDFLRKKYHKKHKEVITYSNLGIGNPITMASLHSKIVSIEYDPKKVYFFLIDEIQSYFPKDTKNKVILDMIDKLTGDFSQLGKRQIYVFSTAQVYGRLNKNLREQCLYMVHCRRSMFTSRFVNDFIDGDDVMCDDLGRWSGIPKKILVHGLPKLRYDTHRLITE